MESCDTATQLQEFYDEVARNNVKELRVANPKPQAERQSVGTPALIQFDGNHLPGYHADTIRRVGNSVAPHLHTVVQPFSGSFTPQMVTVNVDLRNGDSLTNIGRLTMLIPPEGITCKDLSVEDRVDKFPELEWETGTPHGNKDKAYYKVTDAAREKFAVKNLRDLTTSQVVACHEEILEIEGKSTGKVRFVQNRLTFKTLGMMPQSVQDKIKAVAENLHTVTNKSTPVEFLIHIIPRPSTRRDWDGLTAEGYCKEPYAEPLEYCRDMTDLSWKNIQVGTMDDPTYRAPPAAITWSDSTHRAVTLMGGVKEEYNHAVDEADKCADQIFDCAIYPLEASVEPLQNGESGEDYRDRVGISLHKLPRKYLVCLKPGIFSNTLPDEGSPVKFFFKAGLVQHEPPVKQFSIKQKDNLLKNMLYNLDLAQVSYENWYMNRKQYYVKRAQDPDDIDEDSLQKESDLELKKQYASHLFEFISQPSPEEMKDEKIKNDPVAWMTNQAVEVGETLSRMGNESEEDQTRRIAEWIEGREAFIRDDVDDEAYEFFGVRIAHPSGCSDDIAAFVISAPRQMNWTPGLDAPIVGLMSEHLIPPMPNSERVHERKGLGPLIRWMLKNEDRHVETILSADVDAKSYRVECKAIERTLDLNVGTLAEITWKWLENFDSPPPAVDWCEIFPAVARLGSDGKLNASQMAAIESLKSSPGGKAFIVGGPGAGKTRVGRHLVGAVLDSPPVVKDESGEDDEKDVQNQEEYLDVNDVGQMMSAAVKDQKRKGKLNAERFREIKERQDVDVDSKVRKTGKEIDLPFGIKEHDIDAKDNAAKIIDSPTISGPVWWTVGQHLQVDDIVGKIREDRPQNSVIRVYSWKRELDNVLTNVKKDTTEYNETKPGMENTLIKFLVDDEKKNLVFKNPASDENSLSEVAKRIVAASNKYHRIRDAWYNAENDPISFKKNGAEARGEARQLLLDVARKADFLAGTPAALDDIAIHLNTPPRMYVVDEAAHMTECMSLVLFSHFPETPAIFIGDPMQPGPLDKLSKNKEVGSRYSKQRALSLMDRLYRAGQVTAFLGLNQRCKTDAANHAARVIYTGLMTIAEPKHPLGQQAMKYFGSLLPSGQNTGLIWLDVPGATETNAGTSYTNETNARVAVETAVRLYREGGMKTVMIVTHYKRQFQLYQALIGEIPPWEVPVGAITARTTASAPSSEADAIVLDYVRTSEAGFTIDLKLQAVAETRCRFLQVVIGCPRLKGFEDSILGSYHQWIVDRNGIVAAGDLSKWCENCVDFHETSEENCTKGICCGRCAGKHAGRLCEAEMSEELIDKMDNVERIHPLLADGCTRAVDSDDVQTGDANANAQITDVDNEITEENISAWTDDSTTVADDSNTVTDDPKTVNDTSCQESAQDRQRENRRNRQAQGKKMRPPPVRTVRKRGKESYREMIHRAVETGSSKQVIQPLELPTDAQPSTDVQSSTDTKETSSDAIEPVSDEWSGEPNDKSSGWGISSDTTSGWDIDCDEIKPVQSTDSQW